MPPFKSIGLSYTLRCPLACDHCITDSTPKTDGRMRLEQAQAYLPVIRQFSDAVCFTGGEPLLYHREIVELARQANELGLEASLVTGAGWVGKESSARRRVRELATAGVSRICISWDSYHEVFSPRKNAVLLARLSVEAGMDLHIRTVIPPGGSLSVYQEAFQGLPVVFETIGVAAVGRAASLPHAHFHWTEFLPVGACTAVFSSNIEPDGNVFACCGPSRECSKSSPLLLGNVYSEPLEAILERAACDPVLEAIHLLGPIGLHQILQGHAEGKNFERRREYAGICDLCLDITNNSRFVTAIRERLQDADVQRLVVAARLWMQKKLGPELNRERFGNMPPRKERHEAGANHVE